MERQRLLALHPGKCKGCAATLSHNRTIGRLSRQNSFPHHRHHASKMTVNGASKILGFSSWKVKGLCDIIDS